MFTKKQLDKIGKKHDGAVEVGVWQYADDTVTGEIEVYFFGYQAHGKPGRISDGVIAMNRLTDERQDRPKGYWLAHQFETSPGWNVCFMVSDRWLKSHKGLAFYQAAWEQEFKKAQ
ncbi:hypothetical protein [Saccharibacillus brassicae]|uniref:Uncharacterized protein n=1 Tax=Saccharibacillus brassicae TaxID=2583377 RepID=A0A4Y6V4P6_SACBS|nr:hypothetical protein [Saccharibacillus brassicae]QDH23477.1 hypothetical protein FFV09_22995 [Saccharibacillus brassicae]